MLLCFSDQGRNVSNSATHLKDRHPDLFKGVKEFQFDITVLSFLNVTILFETADIAVVKSTIFCKFRC